MGCDASEYVLHHIMVEKVELLRMMVLCKKSAQVVVIPGSRLRCLIQAARALLCILSLMYEVDSRI